MLDWAPIEARKMITKETKIAQGNQERNRKKQDRTSTPNGSNNSGSQNDKKGNVAKENQERNLTKQDQISQGRI